MSKRHKMSEISIHHRLSKRNGGSHDESNKSEVSPQEHNAYNIIFNDGHMHPINMAKRLTATWIRPDWVMIAVPRHIDCMHCAICTLEAHNGDTSLDFPPPSPL